MNESMLNLHCDVNRRYYEVIAHVECCHI